MARPEVSVCVPVFNRRAGLQRSLESVLVQEQVDFEVVVGDNASTDGSLALARDYARHDPRFRVLTHPVNRGALENWRACLTAASGAFVKYLGSDDELMPGALCRMVRELEDHSVGFVYTGVAWTHHDGSRGLYYDDAPEGAIISRTFLQRAATMLDTVPSTLAAAMVRRADALSVLEEPRLRTLSSATLGALTLWQCCKEYRFVRRLSEVLVATNDTYEGAPTARAQGNDVRSSLWWEHRGAFSEFLAQVDLPPDLRTELRALLFLATVPLGRAGFAAVSQRIATDSGPRWRDVIAAVRSAPVRRSLLMRIVHAPSVDEIDW